MDKSKYYKWFCIFTFSQLSPVFIAFVLLFSITVRCQTIVENMPVTNGTVYSVVNNGRTIYIGGNFTYIGPYTGSGVPFDINTGNVKNGFPKVNGDVHVVIPDGSGGWYIGGQFDKVGGVAVTNSAHINADMSVDPNWTPVVGNSGSVVYSLAKSGSTVYIGGNFFNIGDSTRSFLGAVNATDGKVTGWYPGPVASWVVSMAISGSTIYVGGAWKTIGDSTRSGLAAINASTGKINAWHTVLGGYGLVNCMVLSGSTLYIGGMFVSVGDSTRNNLAAINLSTGKVTSWNPDISESGSLPNVKALAISASTVYAGGAFSNVGDSTRYGIAAINISSGIATSWNPMGQYNTWVDALAISGSTLYAGGNFNDMGDSTRNGLAAINLSTGNVTSWQLLPDFPVFALAANGSTIYAGGNFNSVGGKIRNNLAAVNASTGNVTSWNPDVLLGSVNALAISGSIIYAGGGFTYVGYQSQPYIAAIDSSTGNVMNWDPGVNGTVLALSVSGTNVYAGGQFTQIGDSTRNYIAAINKSTGKATGWNPNISSTYFGAGVWALLNYGSKIYAGGVFTGVGDSTRNFIAAIDSASGKASSWNPNADNAVNALAASGNLIYAGGSFLNIGDSTRNYIAAIDNSTGKASNWNPNADYDVWATKVSGNTVYVGGGFTTIGGQNRNDIAAVNISTGKATVWNPNANYPIYTFSIDSTNNRIYAGGAFGRISDEVRSNFAGLYYQAVPLQVKPSSSVPAKFILYQNYPNPFNPTTTIKYIIPKAEDVTLKIYDILGNEVETLVNKEQHAGSYSVQFPIGSRQLASGVYLYRLQAGSYIQTKKMILLK